jgi:hypothetical protein
MEYRGTCYKQRVIKSTWVFWLATIDESMRFQNPDHHH